MSTTLTREIPRMSLADQVKEVCEAHKLLDPIELLTGLTNGIDLRKTSLVYEWILGFEEEAGEDPPDDFEWAQLKELVKAEFRFRPVDISESLSAQKVLMEYLHSKKKSVDMSITSTDATVKPLTPREVRLFKRKFNRIC